MRSSREIFNDIRGQLISIKQHGGAIDQYDTVLFHLFIEARKNHYMDFHCTPRLTGQAIVDELFRDADYLKVTTKVSYSLEERFNEKWTIWTEAFEKGFKGNFIAWVPDS